MIVKTFAPFSGAKPFVIMESVAYISVLRYMFRR